MSHCNKTIQPCNSWYRLYYHDF